MLNVYASKDALAAAKVMTPASASNVQGVSPAVNTPVNPATILANTNPASAVSTANGFFTDITNKVSGLNVWELAGIGLGAYLLLVREGR
jgi:hypothetical protein